MDLSQRKILISREDIAKKVKEMGQQITEDYKDQEDRKSVV